MERIRLDDDPDLVVIQVYITNAYRAYKLADHYRSRGSYVVLGGLHVTSLPDEAAAHADSIFLGPGEHTFPEFLRDLEAGTPKPIYKGGVRTIEALPPIHRDLIRRELYLVPNSIVVSRGCPHHCDFCYKDAFFKGGRSFYTQRVDAALAEIARLPGRHLYFLDDHLLGHTRFATELFEGMTGMGRLFQGAATVDSILRGDVIVKATQAGLRSIFVGFETLSPTNLKQSHKNQNLGRDYRAAIRRLDELGILINGSFVLGFDDDGPDVFARTVDWALDSGITTATFHIMTPYPDTALFKRMEAEGRIRTRNWDLYDTRHVVYETRGMSAAQLKDGYDWAYRKFYEWGSIARASSNHVTLKHRVKHFAYASGWKKFEPLWDWVIRAKRLNTMRSLLEAVLSKVTAKEEPDSHAQKSVPAPVSTDTARV